MIKQQKFFLISRDADLESDTETVRVPLKHNALLIAVLGQDTLASLEDYFVRRYLSRLSLPEDPC